MPLPRRSQYHREVAIGALTHPAGAAAAVSEGRLEVRLGAPGKGEEVTIGAQASGDRVEA